MQSFWWSCGLSRRLGLTQPSWGCLRYRFPTGESGADVYDRTKQWWDSMMQRFLMAPEKWDFETISFVFGKHGERRAFFPKIKMSSMLYTFSLFAVLPATLRRNSPYQTEDTSGKTTRQVQWWSSHMALPCG